MSNGVYFVESGGAEVFSSFTVGDSFYGRLSALSGISPLVKR